MTLLSTARLEAALHRYGRPARLVAADVVQIRLLVSDLAPLKHGDLPADGLRAEALALLPPATEAPREGDAIADGTARWIVRSAVPVAPRDGARSAAVRGAALDRGYLRLALTLEEDLDGLGAAAPRSGRLGLTVAVPAGRGSDAGDAIIDSLNTGLSYGGSGRVRFGGLALTPGRQIGQLWVTEAEIGFAVWPGMAAGDPGRAAPEGTA